MKKIVIVDSIDKRMTVPLVNDLKSKGYDVHGLCFLDSVVLCSGLTMIHRLDKTCLEAKLGEILAGYDRETTLLVGNPLMIAAVNVLKPSLRYLLPTPESIAKAEDKKSLMTFAAALGLRVPKATRDTFPLVVKLNNSEQSGLGASKRYRIVPGPDQLQGAVADFSLPESDLLFQEYVTGTACGVTMLLDRDSNLVDYIVHERKLEYPISGGPSALCETVDKPALAEAALKLLQGLHWQGIAMVEFKGDCLLEINPRFWGSMPLVFRAASGFFDHYLGVAAGAGGTSSLDKPGYKTGVRMYYLPQALLALADLIKNHRGGEARHGLGLLFGAKEGIFRLRCPLPFFRYIGTLLKRGRL